MSLLCGTSEVGHKDLSNLAGPTHVICTPQSQAQTRLLDGFIYLSVTGNTSNTAVKGIKKNPSSIPESHPCFAAGFIQSNQIQRLRALATPLNVYLANRSEQQPLCPDSWCTGGRGDKIFSHNVPD